MGTKLIYRVHLGAGDQDYATEREAMRHARNLAGAMYLAGCRSNGIWVTEEEVDASHPVIEAARA